ncbi:uncharacterized protein LOC134196752 [Corticium candelabrum]|uniref:uncharacterized protein LOC134196752 n=1 Tax=Corticium candelabrum TaxID=121492 RepID=UPI002E257A1F|nr:uncharacterized protein LOC134196752 [Corticium candelabrum]
MRLCYVLLQISIAAAQHEFTVHATWKSYHNPNIPIRFTLQLPTASPSSRALANKVYFRICNRDASLTWTRCDNRSEDEQTPVCQQIGNCGLACVTSASYCNITFPTIDTWYMLQLHVDTIASKWTPVCDPDGLLNLQTTSGPTTARVPSNRPNRPSTSDTSTSTINLEIWQIALVAVGGVILITIIIILLVCCGCFRRNSKTYEVQNRLSSNLLRHEPVTSRNTVHSSRLSLRSKGVNNASKRFWRQEENNVEIRPDIDIVPVYNNPLNAFVTGTTNRIPLTNRNTHKHSGVPASGDVIFHPVGEETNYEQTFSSFVATTDHVVSVHTHAQSNPKSFSQAVGLGRRDVIGQQDATELEVTSHSETSEDSVELETPSNISMTTSL